MARIGLPTVGASEDTWGQELNDYLNAVRMVINVKEYGAVGDGVTDDTVAIQAAIDSLTDEVGTLFFPPGIYVANNLILDSEDTAKVPKYLLIKGYGATLLNKHASNPTFSMEVTSPPYRHDVYFEGLRFDGNGESNIGIKMEGALNIKVRNCAFYQHKTAAIYATDCWSCQYENLAIIGKDSGADATNGIYSDGAGGNVVYKHVVARDCTNGINSKGNHGGGGFFGCDLNNCGHGILLTDGFGTVITGSWFEGNVTADIYAGSGGAQQGLVIQGNHFGAGAPAAIKLNHVIGPIIQGNDSLGHDWFILGDSSNTHLEAKDIHYNKSSDTAFHNLGIPSLASAATVTLPAAGSEFIISGTTDITSVAVSWKGHIVTLSFADVLIFTDGSNLKLAGHFVTADDSTITIMCDGTNWNEVSRSDATTAIPVMTDTDETPSVKGITMLRSLGTTTITDFDDGVERQMLTFLAETSITITDGTNILLSGSANFEMTDTDTLTLIQKADGKWYETGRSDSGA